MTTLNHFYIHQCREYPQDGLQQPLDFVMAHDSLGAT